MTSKEIKDRINSIKSKLTSYYGTKKMDKRYVFKGTKSDYQLELEKELKTLEEKL